MRSRRTIRVVALAVFLITVLSGCVTLRDPESSQEYSGDHVARLTPDQTVAQSLVSRRSGFNGLQIWLRQQPPPPDPEAVITVELYHTTAEAAALINGLPQDAAPIAVSQIRFSALVKSFPASVRFPTQPDPPGQAYVVVLKTTEGEVNAFGRLEDADPNGRLYVQGEAQNGDLAYRAMYDYNPTEWLADLRRLAAGVWLVIPLLLVLWVPGRLLLNGFFRSRRLDRGVCAGLSVASSLALIPIILLWTGALGLRWTRPGVIIAFGAAGAALAFLLWRDRPKVGRFGWKPPDNLDLALATIFAVTLAVRLIMARDLAAPPWVDPVHHSVIVRSIIDAGRFPSDYLPYVETNTANYHPGFHAAVAAFHWLSGLTIPDAMLLFGQVQNALITLAVYLASVAVSRDRLTGVLAALAAGLFSPMPAYYLSWGRYTQLAGTLILPGALFFIREILDRSGREKIGPLLLGALTAAGMFLTHYRVAAFFAVWSAAFMIAEILRSLHRRPLWRSLPDLALSFAAVGSVAVVLSLPWWPSLFSTMLAPALEAGPRAGARLLKIEWNFLTPAYGRQLLWLASAGLIVSIARLRWFGPTLLLWVGMLFISAGQGMIRLPLAGNVNKTSVEIFLFLPISILSGYCVAEMIRLLRAGLPPRLRFLAYAAAALILIVGSFFGARKVAALYNPVTVLARAADRPALEWIDANLPPTAVVLINPFLWGYGLYAGQDGGFWITPVAGRRSIPPPVLYGLNPREQIKAIIQPAAQALKAGKDPQALYDLMLKHGSRYVFLGRRGGVISAQALADSPLFLAVYHEDGVWVFEAVGVIEQP